ncbi:uncharacterized protein BO87DRAFT_379357 [Aspergillus neoniger CBS 115656]|uniref:Uncharacterized protein n=1 Tax=Aspergillus neoniger (strain CBS 115656) TaxID=1448310 RepID=A0A318YEU8_ASPNB|nr:hypothetical protein BO87DRAFT_379357 [Aspergillus neoniger CBS 115656]PYH30953.1 hypothetical protein BO87DRAFT_379357 [Aspergillus neoniger CBS 115656]
MTGCLPNQAARCEVLRPLLHFTRNRNLTSSRLCSSYTCISFSYYYSVAFWLLPSPGYPVVSLLPSPVSSGARSSHLSLPLSAPLSPSSLARSRRSLRWCDYSIENLLQSWPGLAFAGFPDLI